MYGGAVDPNASTGAAGGTATGTAAPTEGAGGYNIQADPGYQFRVDEGLRNRSRGASAGGVLLSGGFGRAITEYSQDMASQEYMNIYNRISNIAGMGQVAQQGANQGALAYGAQAGAAASNAGYARASGYAQQGNIWGNAINEISRIDWGGGGNSFYGNNVSASAEGSSIPGYSLKGGLR